MPPIVTILIVLAIAVLVVVMVTSKNPTQVTQEQANRYSKIFRILLPILLIGVVLKYFFFSG